MRSAIDEFNVTFCCNVTELNKIVTLTNRRIEKEFKEKNSSRLRVKKYREKHECNGNVTPPSSSSSSSSIKNYIKKEIDFSGNWDEQKRMFLQDEEWMIKTTGQLHVVLLDLMFLMQHFVNELEVKEDYKPQKEIKSHFVNWYRKTNPNIQELKKSKIYDKSSAPTESIRERQDRLNREAIN